MKLFYMLVIALGFAGVNNADSVKSPFENVFKTRVLSGSLKRLSYTTIYNAVNEADVAADNAWLKLNSVEDYEKYCQELKRRMFTAIGQFPEKCDLNVRSVATIERDGYKVEKVIFDSVSGVPITALLYLPNDVKYKPPYTAFVVTCGHSDNGKGCEDYQRACVLGAKNGLSSIIYDPIAQGERMQLPDTASVHGHNRLGALAALLGDSMARFRIWDGMRVMDYLDSRPDIIHDGYGLMGNSGGGTMTSLIMALDKRVKAACPSCYLSSIRDVYSQMGPQDAEQNIFGQLAFFLNHASLVLMGGNAVNMCCCHDDMFPFEGSLSTWRVVKSVNDKFGFSRYAMTDVAGPHGWKESIRVASVEWVKNLNCKERNVCKKEARKCDLGFELSKVDTGLKDYKVAPNGKISELPGFRSVYDVLRDELVVAEKQRKKLRQNDLQKAVRELAGIGNIKLSEKKELSRSQIADVKIVKQAFTFTDGIVLPVIVFEPPTISNRQPLLLISDGDKSDWRDLAINRVKQGRMVMVADLIGSGEIGKTKHSFYGAKNADEEIAVMLYALGKSLVGVRADEILAITDFAHQQYGEKVEVVAKGRMAIPAAHAFVSNRSLFSKVVLEDPPLSWTDAVQTSAKYPFANVVNSALKFYDWPNLL